MPSVALFGQQIAVVQGKTFPLEHANGAMTLPMQTIVFTMLEGGTFTADITMPRITVVGGGAGNAALTVPMQQLAATGTVNPLFTVAMVLPMMTLTGAGITGAMFTVDLTVPMQQLVAYGGGRAALIVPMQQLAATGSTSEGFSAALRLPMMQLTGNVSVFSSPGGAHLVLPMIVPGPYGNAALTLPMLQLAAFGGLLTPVYQGWIMNMRNNTVARLTNWPFTEFVTVGNKTYGIGAGGLYLLGGDTDNGAPIAWEFETGLDDFDRPGVKYIPYLYLDGIIDGVVQITLIDDRGRRFAYEYDTKTRGAIHLRHRRKLGNGIRTTNAAFNISSIEGAYIELDALEPEITVTQRNI